MDLRENIIATIDIVNEILRNISFNRFNLIPQDLPNLNFILTNIKAKFESLLPERIFESINPICTALYLEALRKYLNDLSKESASWKGNLKQNQEEELIIIHSKMETLAEFLEIVPYVSRDDLFSLDKSHERWRALARVTETYHRDRAEVVRQKYKKFMNRVAAGQAFVSKAYEEEEGIKRKLMLGFGSMYYTLAKSKALRKTQLLYAKPRIDVAIHT